MPAAATHRIDVAADARFGRSAPLSQLLLRLKAASGGGVTLFPSRRPAGFGYSPTNELNPRLPVDGGAVRLRSAWPAAVTQLPASLSADSHRIRDFACPGSGDPGGDRIGFCSLIAHMDRIGLDR